MKTLRQFSATLLYLFLLTAPLQSAERYDDKAFRVAKKLCGKCHGTPFFFAKQFDEEEWEAFFEDPRKLPSLHASIPSAQKSFRHGWFQNKRERLLKFFINHSKYAGTVHGCDGNFCGANRKKR